MAPWPAGSWDRAGTEAGCDRAPGTGHCLREKPHPKGGNGTPSQVSQNPGLIKEVYIN